MANAEYEKKAKELADSLTDEELTHLAGGEMTPEERQKLAKILEITIPTGAAAAVAIGCGTAAIVGMAKGHGWGYYFTHPFGKNPYGIAPPTPPQDTPNKLPTTPLINSAEKTPTKKDPAAMGGVPLTGMT